ncbi:unnamed protein product [Effrenium voratum]|nr:unnamed protein product [Effrenium voratum]
MAVVWKFLRDLLRPLHRKLVLLALAAVASLLWPLHFARPASDGRCWRELFSCQSGETCLDAVSAAECNGTWLGPSTPIEAFQARRLPQLLNLAPPKSGTTDLYRRLLGLAQVVPGKAEKSKLCGARPQWWCEKEGRAFGPTSGASPWRTTPRSISPLQRNWTRMPSPWIGRL